MDSGWIDPEDVINELMEGLHLDSSTAEEGDYQFIRKFMFCLIILTFVSFSFNIFNHSFIHSFV